MIVTIADAFELPLSCAKPSIYIHRWYPVHRDISHIVQTHRRSVRHRTNWSLIFVTPVLDYELTLPCPYGYEQSVNIFQLARDKWPAICRSGDITIYGYLMFFLQLTHSITENMYDTPWIVLFIQIFFVKGDQLHIKFPYVTNIQEISVAMKWKCHRHDLFLSLKVLKIIRFTALNTDDGPEGW